MAILKKSCCGCDMKTGSIVVAIIWIILAVIGSGFASYGFAITVRLGVVSPTNVVLLIVYTLSFINHILLIIGVVQKARPLLLTWVIVIIICTVVTLIIYVISTVATYDLIAILASRVPDFLREGLRKSYEPGIALTWTFWSAQLIMTVYGSLVVISHYQNLRDGVPRQGQQQMMVMGNQPYMVGNQPYMVGNQPYMIGNQLYMIGNQPNMMGNKLQPNMGNQPTVVGNQPNMMGNHPAMVGNQPMATNRPRGTSNLLYK